MTPEPASALQHALSSLGVALGAGLLVGLEREQSQMAREVRRFAGIRTFALLSLLGASAALLGPAIGGWLVPRVVEIDGAVLTATAVIDNLAGRDRGLTTEIAALLVLLLGIFAATPVEGLSDIARWSVIATVSIVTMALLSLRTPLHHLAERVSSEDLYATAKLGLVLLVALPLLPRRQVGPIAHLNPFEVGLFVALIAAIGFVGYVAVRLLGPHRGMTVTGLVGGLVSSTAVTLNFAGRVREVPALAPVASLGIVLASTIMFPRMLLEVAVVDPTLLPAASAALGGAAVTGAVLTAALYLRYRAPGEAGGEVSLRNPFSLEQAVKFGAFYVVILVASDLAVERFGDVGLYASSLLAGLTDVDAITLSVSRLHRDGLDTGTAQRALLIAAASNTIVKGGMTMLLGGWHLGKRVAGIFVPMLAVGAALAWLTG